MRRLAAIAAMLGLAGCGLSADGAPRDLAVERVPFELLEPTTSTATTSTTSPVATAPAFVWVIGQGRLVPVVRELPSPLTLRDAIAALLKGPSEDEAGRGLRTSITTEVRLRAVAIDGNVATLNLSEQFAVGNPQQIEALAQLVFTATGVPGVASVRVAIEGEVVEVPTGDGTLTRTPVGRAQFAALAPA